MQHIVIQFTTPASPVENRYIMYSRQIVLVYLYAFLKIYYNRISSHKPMKQLMPSPDRRPLRED